MAVCSRVEKEMDTTYGRLGGLQDLEFEPLKVCFSDKPGETLADFTLRHHGLVCARTNK